MDVDDSADSDCELVIDETIITNQDQDEFSDPENISEIEKPVPLADVSEHKWNIFHPISISSADMKEELFHEETNTCSICNLSFRYNVGLIYHLEMEHVELKVNGARKNKKLKTETKRQYRRTEKKCATDGDTSSNDNQTAKPKKVVSGDLVKRISISKLVDGDLKLVGPTFKRSCDVCKKIFSDQMKLTKHTENCIFKFQCVYCKSKFGWESKYKKHLFKTHKLNAAVICKCSKVYPDMAELALHRTICSYAKDDVVVDVEEIELVQTKQVRRFPIVNARPRAFFRIKKNVHRFINPVKVNQKVTVLKDRKCKCKIPFEDSRKLDNGRVFL